MPNDVRDLPAGNDGLYRFLGGTPLAVAFRLILLSILVGASLGILTGITFGERTAALQPLGVVYAMMLESVVYPYILSSLIVGLGSLAIASLGGYAIKALDLEPAGAPLNYPAL